MGEGQSEVSGGRDRHLVQGQWVPVDVLADCPDDGGDVAAFLAEKGWETFLPIGSTDSVLYLRSWQRFTPDGVQYLLEVGGVHSSALAPYLLFDSLPEFMDMYTRWAPAVQAAHVVSLLDFLADGEVAEHGLVETIAARAVLGIESGVPVLRKNNRRHAMG